MHPDILEAIRRALAEDIGTGDLTSESIIPVQAAMQGRIIAKQPGLIAGLDVAGAVYAQVDPNIVFSPKVEEGSQVENGQTLALVSGPARSLLTGERTALNFLGRMSGIASLTHRFVEAVSGTRAIILDTRKTAPGLRRVDKLAVQRGGGRNHRVGLYDMILIKDNHIDFAGGLAEAVGRARRVEPNVGLEVETRTLEEVRAALDLNIKRILLDNMTVEMLAQAVSLARGQAQLEASGNVTLENVRRIAETGVDFISIGALTHSVQNFDVSLDYVK